jgi:hypothetical protein
MTKEQIEEMTKNQILIETATKKFNFDKQDIYDVSNRIKEIDKKDKMTSNHIYEAISTLRMMEDKNLYSLNLYGLLKQAKNPKYYKMEQNAINRSERLYRLSQIQPPGFNIKKYNELIEMGEKFITAFQNIVRPSLKECVIFLLERKYGNSINYKEMRKEIKNNMGLIKL